MINANDISKYFLYKAYQDEELLTNLKLQKLLYYSQGYYLALFNKALFVEDIQSWTHGPVVPDIYHSFKEFGANPLPWVKETDIDVSSYDPDTREFLDEIYSVFGQFSAFALRDMTHQEAPWIQTPSGSSIDLDLMTKFFKTRVNNGENSSEASKN